MKKFKLLPVLALATMFLFVACDDDLLDVTESFTFETEFVVFSGEPSFTDNRVVDLAQDQSLINQYGSKIKRIELESVRYWLKAHEGTETQQLESLTLNVANADGTDSKNIIQLDNLVLAALLNNPTDLPLNSTGVNKLETLAAEPPHQFLYLLEATANEVPLDFTIVFEVTAKMTANPLN